MDLPCVLPWTFRMRAWNFPLRDAGLALDPWVQLFVAGVGFWGLHETVLNWACSGCRFEEAFWLKK